MYHHGHIHLVIASDDIMIEGIAMRRPHISKAVLQNSEEIRKLATWMGSNAELSVSYMRSASKKTEIGRAALGFLYTHNTLLELTSRGRKYGLDSTYSCSEKWHDAGITRILKDASRDMGISYTVQGRSKILIATAELLERSLSISSGNELALFAGHVTRAAKALRRRFNKALPTPSAFSKVNSTQNYIYSCLCTITATYCSLRDPLESSEYSSFEVALKKSIR